MSMHVNTDLESLLSKDKYSAFICIETESYHGENGRDCRTIIKIIVVLFLALLDGKDGRATSPVSFYYQSGFFVTNHRLPATTYRIHLTWIHLPWIHLLGEIHLP